MILATVLMLDGELGRIDGAILAVALFGMMGWVLWLGMRSENPDEVDDSEIPKDMKTGAAIFWIIAGSDSVG